MSVAKSWGHFYENAGDADYLLDHVAIQKDFLKEIFKRNPERILEAGCGSAIMSIFFAMSGKRVSACDLDEGVLSKAAETAKKWKVSVDFSKQDLLKLNFKDDSFDVVFSQGVLEHLNDDQIRQACRESLRIAPAFIFSVPGYYYNHKDFGDERLLKDSQWDAILKGVGRAEWKPYYFIRAKRNFLIKRPIMLMGIITR